jgi:hypothetical protein
VTAFRDACRQQTGVDLEAIDLAALERHNAAVAAAQLAAVRARQLAEAEAALVDTIDALDISYRRGTAS